MPTRRRRRLDARASILGHLVGAADRLTFHAGDFFKQDIPKADVVLMGHILHDWDLPTKKMLIKKAFDALPTGGALIVYDARTLKEVKRLPMSKPVGKYNVWNKISRSEGTSH